MTEPLEKEPLILVADDDPTSRTLVSYYLSKQGFDVVQSENGAEAEKLLSARPVSLVIADYLMPEMDGIKLLKRIRNKGREIPFVLITAHGSVDLTLEAITLKATEYLAKPLEPGELIRTVRSALNLSGEDFAPKGNGGGKTPDRMGAIIGKSPAMQDLYKNIRKAAQATANVLILGESGTGKELAARAIHDLSGVKDGPFITVNCQAYARGTLESELFGHVRGAFTTALRDKPGRFEMADGGTLFLDEVGDIPQEIQVKLLRVLQEKQFERVGGNKTIKSDFRLISATHRNLKSMVREGEFREDLFYRINVISLSVPPLRERSEDIPLLVSHFLQLFAGRNRKDVRTLSMDALKTIRNCSWPGNVRQLENAVESAVALADGPMIRAGHLPRDLTDPEFGASSYQLDFSGTLPEVVQKIETRMIVKALEENQWVKARAARALGVSERVVSYKMQNYGIEREAESPTSS